MAASSEPGYVLVVDDEEDTRDTLREVVEMGGCTAVLAANGAEALKLIAERRPCLVILDLVMPVMSGLEVLEAMTGSPELSCIPVVVSTSAPDRAPRGVPVLPKPIDLTALWQWMQRSCSCGSVTPA